MIEKMMFINIMGPKDDLERVLLKYITKLEISLEDALIELSKVKGLRPLTEENPYIKPLELVQELVRVSKADQDTDIVIDKNEALKIINEINDSIKASKAKIDDLMLEKKHYEDLKMQIEPFTSLEVNLNELFKFKFIRYRFGKLPKDSYKKFEEYVKDTSDAFFIPCESDSKSVWGIYFVPASLSTRNDTIFSSLHFERIKLSREYEGTPLEAKNKLNEKIMEIDLKIQEIEEDKSRQTTEKSEEIAKAYATIKQLNDCFRLRKYAACTKKDFYILTGWATDDTVNEMLMLTKDDKDVELVIEDENSGINSTPPTKLKNFFLFRPFEMFVKMYGIPSYNEMDPTFFVAITYAILFGVMFGDVGQGAVLVIAGLLLYKLKKSDLGAIIAICGVFSTLFGFAYGSIFGYEDKLTALWLSPMHSVTTILIYPVIAGAGIILVCMMFNVINAIRVKDISRLLLDKNGIAGILFYGSVLVLAAFVLAGKSGVAVTVLISFVILGLVLMIVKEPVTHLIQKKKKLIEGNKVMFLVETFFELFEVLLSFITNTVSFVRVGAFALSHAGMMGVVHLLANSASGNPNIMILIFGNILVMGLEGLIVGIQVLRLEFYEIFSRFYTGKGREFRPFNKNI